LQRLPQPADVPQQGQGLLGGVRVEGPLGARVVRRQTPAGLRLLASLRDAHPLETRRASGPRVLMSVALHGDRALLLHTPHFARDGGLLGTGGTDHGFTPDERASGRGTDTSAGDPA
ncbi:hypothetical protein ACWD6S_32930, partial [Streptomyces zhihengii]